MKRPIKPLKGWQVFSKTFEEGKNLRSRYLLISVVRFDETEKDLERAKTQFGVGISKRVAKSAVVRNRVRRLLRESLYSLADEGKLGGIEKIIIFCLVSPKHPMGLKMADVKKEISYLLDR